MRPASGRGFALSGPVGCPRPRRSSERSRLDAAKGAPGLPVRVDSLRTDSITTRIAAMEPIAAPIMRCRIAVHRAGRSMPRTSPGPVNAATPLPLAWVNTCSRCAGYLAPNFRTYRSICRRTKPDAVRTNPETTTQPATAYATLTKRQNQAPGSADTVHRCSCRRSSSGTMTSRA